MNTFRDRRGNLISANEISDIAENEIFVFGSNLAGRHGKGAAKIAAIRFGADRGIGEGPTGRCYAIPTKDRNLFPRRYLEVERSIARFLDYATKNPDKTFLVTRIGCGFAGFLPSEIGRMFAVNGIPDNCAMPLDFIPHLIDNSM